MISKAKTCKITIVYKKTDEWQRVNSSGTTHDNEWFNEWQQVVQQETTNDNEWKRVTKNDNDWQRMTASNKTNEYEWE